MHKKYYYLSRNFFKYFSSCSFDASKEEPQTLSHSKLHSREERRLRACFIRVDFKMDLRGIACLDGAVVHRMCSGQVVVDLSTAVKELIENSIDAGATVVSVKLKEYGWSSIEVTDNGSGVAPSQHAALVKKYHTSKISSFEDLDGVSSFGFRGEALSSLCEISGGFTVKTRTKDQSAGFKIEYAPCGAVKNSTSAACSVGTSIVVTELFAALAVRRREFKRTLKRQYAKMLSLLQAYALVSTGVRISCINVTGSGKKTKRASVLSTQGKDAQSNICSVFGSSFFRELSPLDTPISVRDAVGDAECKISGYVSKAGHGVGRSSSDRQFWYVNGRPVDLPKFTKVVNELWRRFEMKHMPAFVLNLTLPPGLCDMNVSPDKRSIFVAEENQLIDSIKDILREVWEPSRYTYQTRTIEGYMRGSVEVESALPVTEAKAATSDRTADDLEDAQEKVAAASAGSSKTALSLSSKAATNDRAADDLEGAQEKMATASAGSSKTVLSLPSRCSPMSEDFGSGDARVLAEDVEMSRSASSSVGASSAPMSMKFGDGVDPHPKEVKTSSNSRAKSVPLPQTRAAPSRQHRGYAFKAGSLSEKKKTDSGKRRKVRSRISPPVPMRCCSIASIKKKLSIKRNAARQPLTAAVPINKNASVDNCGGNEEATRELERVFDKSQFLTGVVCGQFNLGFIVTRFDDDLFIVDQHAADEKYNFETLQRNTTIHEQKLIQPLPIELGPTERQIVNVHRDVFAKNGFHFVEKQLDNGVSQLCLSTLPHSKQTQFGPEDVRELAALIRDVPPPGKRGPEFVYPKLPKLRSMFASRACRSSVMIGTALDDRKMKSIVRNLSGLEQPWNCPHGRPTMRHLISLRELQQRSDAMAELTGNPALDFAIYC